MSYTVINGTTIRFYTSTPFTSIGGTVVDPDVVTFAYTVQGQTTVTYTYTNGNTPPDPTYTIVKDSTGTYHADIPSTSTGNWFYKWSGQPGVSALDTTKTSAIFNGTVTVSPSNP